LFLKNLTCSGQRDQNCFTEKKKERAAWGIITGVKLEIEEKPQEKEEEEGCMERNVHIGSEWWKIITIYSKVMTITTRRAEETMKKDREESEEKEIDKRRGGIEKENPKTRWKMQRGRN
jgi:hypothetical protein